MKKRVIAVLISAILLYQPLSVSAAAAPDGMTDASRTPAAQNGAWYTKEGEEASFVYGQTPDLSDGQQQYQKVRHRQAIRAAKW